MQPRRITTRRLMVLVAVVAMSLWLAIPAVEILSDPARHRLTHLWKRRDGGGYLFTEHQVGFWMRYRRRLLGLPWDCPYEWCKENASIWQDVSRWWLPDLLLPE